MAKDKIADYDASAAGNTDIGGIGIQGTNQVSNFDGAFREIMSQLKDADAGTSALTDTWSFCDPADRTKIFRLDAGSITTATTRVITVPNVSSTMAVLGLAQTWTAAQTFPTGTNVTDAGFSTLKITSSGAGSDPILELDAVGGSWNIQNDDSAANVLDLRWEGTSKYTFSTAGTIAITGASPVISMTDSDTGAVCGLNANSAAGSLFITADSNNAVANSVITASVDGTENIRLGGAAFVQTWGGANTVIDPTSGSTDGMTLSNAYRLVRSVDGYQPFQQRRRNSDGVIQEFYRGLTLVGTISVTGSATAYNTSSDERLKHDFKPIDAAILDAIKVYDFAWNADDSRSYGVKAQELDQVIPQAVYKGEDASGMWSVDYSKLVPILIAALQDARKRLADLEAAR